MKRQLALHFETEDDVELAKLVDRIRYRLTMGICTGPQIWVRVAGVTEEDKLLFDIDAPWMLCDKITQ